MRVENFLKYHASQIFMPCFSDTVVCYLKKENAMSPILNRISVYGVILLCLVMSGALLGCEARNPICSENFCVVGEVFLRSEIGDREFSEVDVNDSQILAVLVGTPQQPTTEPDAEVTVSDIISDVANGGTAYIGETVTLTATVLVNLTNDDQDAIALVTDNEDIAFFVTSHNETRSLADYIAGNSYTFKLYIKDVRESTVTPGHTNIWSHETLLDTEVTLDEIYSDVEAGGTTHIHKTVIVTGTVAWKSDDGETIVISSDGFVEDTAFFVTHREGFDASYHIGSSHTLKVFVEGVTKTETIPEKTNIWSYVIED